MSVPSAATRTFATRIFASPWFAHYRWVPWAFVAAFALVFAVNGGLVYYALDSWPGLTTDHAYDEGLAYNRVLDEAAKEAKLGWKFAIDFASAGKGSDAGRVVIDARDSDGTALGALLVHVTFVRPVGDVPDIVVPLREGDHGRYEAAVRLPRPGQWEVYVVARRNATTFHTGRRIMVP